MQSKIGLISYFEWRTPDGLTQPERQILEILPVGKANAAKEPELAMRAMMSGRAVRDGIRNLRRRVGVLIVSSSSSGKAGGYYLPGAYLDGRVSNQEKKEVVRYITGTMARARKVMALRRPQITEAMRIWKRREQEPVDWRDGELFQKAG